MIQDYSQPKKDISKLPHLAIDQSTSHITRDMADNIIDYLVKNYPERMEKIADYEKGSVDATTIMAYAEAIQTVVQDISKIMDTPDTELGYIELNFELVRRCRKAWGYKLPEIKGISLAPSINGPYPKKLPEKPIFLNAVFEAGFTQEIINAWSDDFYENNKEACYQFVEGRRRDVTFYYLARDPIGSFFKKKSEETGDEKIIRHYSLAKSEFCARLIIASNLHTMNYFCKNDHRRNENIKLWSEK